MAYNKLFILILLLLTLLFSLSFVSADVLNCDVNTYTQYGVTDDKSTWLCTLNGTNSSVNCISYVKDNLSGIVQTNPTYHKKSNALIGFSNEVDDRTSFVSQNNLVSVFFTKDNLIFDGRNYTYGVQCSDGTNIYKFESVTLPEYKNINEPTTRLVWANQNMTGLLLGLLLLFVVIIIISIAVPYLRGRK
jgi:hypothetical protein